MCFDGAKQAGAQRLGENNNEMDLFPSLISNDLLFSAHTVTESLIRRQSYTSLQKQDTRGKIMRISAVCICNMSSIINTINVQLGKASLILQVHECNPCHTTSALLSVTVWTETSTVVSTAMPPHPTATNMETTDSTEDTSHSNVRCQKLTQTLLFQIRWVWNIHISTFLPSFHVN